MHMSHEQAASRSAGIRPRHTERVTAATRTEDELAEMMRADAACIAAKQPPPQIDNRKLEGAIGNMKTVYDALAEPMTARQIADATGLAYRTVRSAINGLNQKRMINSAVVTIQSGAKAYWRAGQ